MNKTEFLRRIDSLTLGIRQNIEAHESGLDTMPEAIEQRQGATSGDFAFFARTYFPHYTRYAPSRLHEFLFQRLPEAVGDARGARLAIAAPRGEAKSTITTLIFTLWCALTGRKKYIPIIMDAHEQAVTMLAQIKAELTDNAALRLDFPEAHGQGGVWREGVIVTRNDCKIQAFGSGKRMRGLRHGPHRPDLVILDDIENNEQVRSPEQRDKLETWLDQTVLSLGAADDSMDVVFIGTILHYDSVLARKIKNPLWESRVFRAVIAWPRRMDLWDAWEEVLLNQGEAAADGYHRERANEMEAGAELSWPAARKLITLMKKRARDGRGAFDSEQQNDPVNQQHAPFGAIRFWVQRNPDWVFFGACDPSLGGRGRHGDPSALLVGGFDRATGILDVVEATIRRRLPDQIIEEIIALQGEYRCLAWAVETVQYQEMLRDELVKRSAARGMPVPARAVKPHVDKALRIQSLQPHVANGLIRFRPDHHTLLEQLRHYPMADHDDGPDALHMLWTIASQGAGMAGWQHTLVTPSRWRLTSRDDDD